MSSELVPKVKRIQYLSIEERKQLPSMPAKVYQKKDGKYAIRLKFGLLNLEKDLSDAEIAVIGNLNGWRTLKKRDTINIQYQLLKGISKKNYEKGQTYYTVELLPYLHARKGIFIFINGVARDYIKQNESLEKKFKWEE